MRQVRRHALLTLALGTAILAAAVYGNALRNGFAHDDVPILRDNAAVHGIARVPAALTSGYWPHLPDDEALYRPLTMAAYAVEWELWDGAPTGYHAVNIALHAIAAALVLLLAVRVGASLPAAAFGAALFAVHPVHTEAVANIVGRAELLAAVFYLVACLIHLGGGRVSWRRSALGGLCYLLALGAKEIAVTLPAVLVLLEVLARRGGAALPHRLRRQWRTFTALAAALALFIAARLAVLGSILGGQVESTLVELGPSGRLATAVRLWAEYARLLLFPRDLIADYAPGVLNPAGPNDPMVWLGAALGAGVVVVGVVAWRRASLLSLAAFWFPITVLPVANILFVSGVYLAERTLYLPSVALSLATAALADRLPRRRPILARAVVGAGLLALALGGWSSWRRNPVWRSSETMLANLEADHPESFRSQWMIGRRLMAQGEKDEGLGHYERAVRLVPAHHELLSEYGLQLVDAGRFAEAEHALRQALALYPWHPEPYAPLAATYSNRGRHRDALHVLGQGLEHRTDWPPIYHALAYAYAGLGQWETALLARRLHLGLAGPRAGWPDWAHLGRIYAELGRRSDAEKAMNRARELAPADVAERLTTERLLPRARRSDNR